MFFSRTVKSIQKNKNKEQGVGRQLDTRRKDPARQDDDGRRVAQRRAFFRANYPVGNGLKILNMDAEVVDIAQKGLRFRSKDQWDELSKIIKNGDILEISLAFRNDEVENINGHLTKCYTDLHSREQYYVLMFTKDIPSKRISEEQSYLLKNFPEFSKQLFIKANQIHE